MKLVQEILMLDVKPGTERTFETAFQQATKVMQQAEGFLDAKLLSCVEQENKYLVAISWETIEAHVNEFKNSPAFQEMKALLGPFYLANPQVGHYKQVDICEVSI
jgi:heme-degrading monooxygenase HmoA